MRVCHVCADLCTKVRTRRKLVVGERTSEAKVCDRVLRWTNGWICICEEYHAAIRGFVTAKKKVACPEQCGRSPGQTQLGDEINFSGRLISLVDFMPKVYFVQTTAHCPSCSPCIASDVGISSLRAGRSLLHGKLNLVQNCYRLDNGQPCQAHE